MYEYFGSKFKLYPKANTVVAIPEQLYGYRQRNNGTIGKTNQPKTFLVTNGRKPPYFSEGI